MNDSLAPVADRPRLLRRSSPPLKRRGRPLGSKGRATIAKDNSAKFDVKDIPVTRVFHEVMNTRETTVCLRGGARSSKSYSVCNQYVTDRFFSCPGIQILVLRKTFPALRVSVYKQLLAYMKRLDLWKYVSENKQTMDWHFGKSLIHFSSLDDPEKIKCFHPETEIFTSKGYKPITQIKIGDLVATMDIETRKVYFKPVSKTFCYNYMGYMYSPASATGDRDPWTGFCVTPNHTFPYATKCVSQIRMEEVRYLPTAAKILQSAKFPSGKIVEYFDIPCLDYSNATTSGDTNNVIYSQPSKYKNNKNGRKPTRFKIRPWLEFLGWYLSEGNLDGDFTVVLSQTKHVGRIRIKKVLDSLGYGYGEGDKGFNIYGKDLVNYLRQFGNCYNKFIPREILDLDPSLLEYIFYALMDGDGHWAKRNKSGYYGSSSIQLAEDFVEVATKLGYATSLRHFTPDYKGAKEHWVVNIDKRDFVGINLSKQWYHGKVHCVEVTPYHTLLTRFHGKTAWAGNSTEWNIIIMEEATEFTYQDYTVCKTRLSSPLFRNVPNQIFLLFNPEDENCWIKTEVIDKEDDCKELISTYKDNPFLTPAYIKILENLQRTDANHWRIYGLGEWGKLEALIFTNWRKIQEKQIPLTGDIVYGLDFGFNNPSALLKMRIDSTEVYIQQKLYESGLTNSQLIEKLKDAIPFKERELYPIYADNAEPDRIEEINAAGFWCVPCYKGRVKDSIDHVKRYRLNITEESDETLKEIRSYSWKKDRNEKIIDEPIAFNDHSMACIRYGIYTHSIGLVQGLPDIKSIDLNDDNDNDFDFPEDREF